MNLINSKGIKNMTEAASVRTIDIWMKDMDVITGYSRSTIRRLD